MSKAISILLIAALCFSGVFSLSSGGSSHSSSSHSSMHSSPIRSSSMHSSPIHSSPIRSPSIHSSPIHSSPIGHSHIPMPTPRPITAPGHGHGHIPMPTPRPITAPGHGHGHIPMPTPRPITAPGHGHGHIPMPTPRPITAPGHGHGHIPMPTPRPITAPGHGHGHIPMPTPRPIIPKPGHGHIPMPTPRPIVPPKPGNGHVPMPTPRPIVTPKPNPTPTPNPGHTPKPNPVTNPNTHQSTNPVKLPRNIVPTPSQRSYIGQYPVYHQSEQGWAKDRLGNGDRSIGGQGCLLTSGASMLAGMGVKVDGKTPDPAVLNADLVKNGGYGNYASGLNYNPFGRYGVQQVGEAKSHGEIAKALESGKGVILKVPGTGGNDHFVLATGVTPTGFKVMDPGHSAIHHYDMSQVKFGRIYQKN